jgi:hypothetical protein
MRSRRRRFARADYKNMTTALSHSDCGKALPVFWRAPPSRFQERGEMLISGVRIKVNARRPPLDLQHYLRIC